MVDALFEPLLDIKFRHSMAKRNVGCGDLNVEK